MAARGKGAADRCLGWAKGGRQGLGMKLCSKARVWGSREESRSGLASVLSSQNVSLYTEAHGLTPGRGHILGLQV